MSISRKGAESVVRQFLPLFKRLNDDGVAYCVVGGIGVMLRALEHDEKSFRMTRDADVMFDTHFENADFARAYLDAYASEPERAALVYRALFGDGSLDMLEADDMRLANTSFVGAKEKYDGVDTPDFDVVRRLNGKELADLDVSTVVFEGVAVPVATPETLLSMKRDTVELLMATRATTSRPQDFDDIDTLESLLGLA